MIFSKREFKDRVSLDGKSLQTVDSRPGSLAKSPAETVAVSGKEYEADEVIKCSLFSGRSYWNTFVC